MVVGSGTLRNDVWILSVLIDHNPQTDRSAKGNRAGVSEQVACN